jgi:predicted GNAT family N-acyltransferase
MPDPTATAIQTLAPSIHDRARFDCGVEALNRYLQQHAMQDMRRRDAACWVIVGLDEPSSILGYYTLSNDSVMAEILPALTPAQRKKLGPYPSLGAYLLGRLAVGKSQQGQGLGTSLLFDAITRCANAEIPAPLMVLDAKDADAEAFYRQFGFEKLLNGRLYAPLYALQERLRSLD